MGSLGSWRGFGKLAALAAAIVCCVQLTQAGASASTIEGWKHSWDTGPVFAETSGGGRILFARDEVAPQEGQPAGRIMNATIDGNYVGRQTVTNPGPLTDITVPDYVDRFAYVNAKGVCKVDLRSSDGAQETCDFGAGSSQPAYSPDGTRLAYVKSGSIWIERWPLPPIEVGDLPTASSFTAKQPVFSADGSRVFFVVEGSDSGQSLAGIWSAASDGTGIPARLTGTADTSPCFADFEPTWRRVEDKVVFVRSKAGCGANGVAGIWQIDPDTAWNDSAWPQGELLSDDSVEASEYSQPTASRDGGLVAYTRLSEKHEGPGSRIHLIDAAGDRALSSPPAGSAGSMDAHPTISANGRYVAFQREIPRGDVSWTSGIFRIDASGANQIGITKSYSYYQQGGGLTGPSIGLSVTPRNPVLKKGKELRLEVTLRNRSGKRLRNVRICAKTGRRLIRPRPPCAKIKKVGPRADVTRTFWPTRHGRAGRQGSTRISFRAFNTLPAELPQATVRIKLR